MSDFLFIDTPASLKTLCQSIQGSPWLALDTEFIREKSYYPRLCLVQIATADTIACIDPLAINDLSALIECLFDESTTKILHAAHQDLEIIYQIADAVPSNLFDTQIAASLLGLGEQIGYGKLVQTQMGISLDKSHTRTDWSRRPLDAAQLTYAADDVRYLGQIYQQQCQALADKGRQDWLQDDFQALSDPERYAQRPEQAWRRIKGNQRLKGRQLAVLSALAAWRERCAREQDKPRKWVLQDDILLDLARFQIKDEAQMSRIRGFEPRSIARYASELLGVIQQAQTLPEADWPQTSERVMLSTDQEAQADLLMGLLRHCAAANDVSAAAIGTRKDIERLILGEQALELLHGWRAQLAGKSLLALLAGELELFIENGQVHTRAKSLN